MSLEGLGTFNVWFCYRHFGVLDSRVGPTPGFYILVLVIERRMLTKRLESLSLGLILVDICSTFQAGAVRNGSGPNFF
jgi:hypothetical protein